MEPGERAPAPGGLRVVQAFVNTNDLEGAQDALGSPAQLQEWLAHHGLPSGDCMITPEDFATAIAVREALRSLALANTGASAHDHAITTLNQVGGLALRVSFDAQGVAHLEPGDTGVMGALSVLLAHVYTAMVNGTWARLKACGNDTCRWVFYDQSKNRSGTWCTMAICGDKLKARAYRKRQQAQVGHERPDHAL
jgi:predicted RNA-binding Zn ribbon-like protein